MNPYEILGVAPNATDEEISKAYKRQAKRYHPDLNPGNASAAEKMGQVNWAYEQIKTMRQRGEDPPVYGHGPGCGPAYGNPFDGFYTGQTYYYTYRPKRSPMGAILAVVVMFFLVRLVLSLIFGSFAGYYYGDPNGGYYYTGSNYGYYGSYQAVPYGDWTNK